MYKYIIVIKSGTTYQFNKRILNNPGHSYIRMSMYVYMRVRELAWYSA